MFLFFVYAASKKKKFLYDTVSHKRYSVPICIHTYIHIGTHIHATPTHRWDTHPPTHRFYVRNDYS